MPFADPIRAADYRRGYYRKKYQTDPSFRRRREDQRLRRIHGLTQEALDALRKRAGGFCELCGAEPARLVIDHDHETGLVRGMVCYDCNRGLAFFDRPGWFRKAQIYAAGAA